MIRLLQDKVIVVREDDRWERALGIAEAVRDEQVVEVDGREESEEMGRQKLSDLEMGKEGRMVIV